MRDAQEAFAARMTGRRVSTRGGASARPTPAAEASWPRDAWTPATAARGAPETPAQPLEDLPSAPPVSLDRFLATHTSEDNASFAEVLESENARRREKYKALAAPPGIGRRDAEAGDSAALRLTDGFGSTGQPSDRLVTWRYEPRNQLMYPGAQRPAAAPSPSERAALSRGPPRAISARSTRFRAAEQGTLLESGSTTPGGASSVDGAASGAGTPRFRGVDGVDYSVLATPTFDPGETTPLMTWGELGATPVRIEAEDLPGGGLDPASARFRIREASAREQAARSLAQQGAATPRRTSAAMQAILAARGGAAAKRRATPLTPAARRLAARSGRAGSHVDLALRASYAAGAHRARPPSAAGGWEAATPAMTPRAATPARAAALPVFEDRAGDPGASKHLTDDLLHV